MKQSVQPFISVIVLAACSGLMSCGTKPARWQLAPTSPGAAGETLADSFEAPSADIEVVIDDRRVLRLCASNVHWQGPRAACANVSVLGCPGDRASVGAELLQLLDPKRGALADVRLDAASFVKRFVDGLVGGENERVLVAVRDLPHRLELQFVPVDGVWVIQVTISAPTSS